LLGILRSNTRGEVQRGTGHEGPEIVGSHISVFWAVTACSLVGGYQSFGRILYPEDGGSVSYRNVVYARKGTLS